MQYIVMPGLIKANTKAGKNAINEFFAKNNWGTVKYKFSFKTLPGQGGSGGRTDVVFLWEGTPQQLSTFAIKRFGMNTPPSWLEDYVDNNRNIIPTKVLKKLKKMRSW